MAAARMFGDYGYRDASLASIADAVGLTQPGLLHHYPSKEALLFAVLQDRELGDKHRVREALGEHPDDVLSALRSLVAYNADHRQDTSMQAVLSAEATSSEHPAHEYFVQRYRRVRHALAQSLHQRAGDRISAEEESFRTLATVVIAVMDGLQLQWLLDPTIDMVGAFEMFADFLAAMNAPSGVGGGGTSVPE